MTEQQPSIQVGDKVALYMGSWNDYYKVATVERITPTGILVLDCEKTLRPDLRERGNNYLDRWEPYTQKIEDYNTASKLRRKLSRFWDHNNREAQAALSLEDLKLMYAIISKD